MLEAHEINQWGRELDIDWIGFCDAKPFTSLEQYLRLHNERLKGFVEQDISKRVNPAFSLPNVKTIVVIGVNHFQNPSELKNLAGSVALFAQGKDYHQVITEKMETLTEKMGAGYQYRCFCDTGPLVDRAVASRTGGGFVGKNLSFITKTFGSRLSLGYILTDAEINFTPQDADLSCGSCTNCIDACPTGALQGDHTMVYEKCVSFLTQAKKQITRHQAMLMGRSIYGCDICQNVCPHNANVPERKEKHLYPIPALQDILKMSNRSFHNAFQDSSLAWIGRKRLQRNAVIALYNMAGYTIEAKQLFNACLQDQRNHIRETAAMLDTVQH